MSIILAQTDTTVGFLSQDPTALVALKGRDSTKPFVKVFSSFKELNKTQRVPLEHRTFVRHAKKTTFIIQNNAYRVVKNHPHARLIEHYRWLYSTSANESGKEYDEYFCRTNTDIIIEDSRGFITSKPSKILKLTSTHSQKLR